MPTDDVENTNRTNYGGDLELIDKPWNPPRGTKRLLQQKQGHKETTLYIDQHILNESKTRRKNQAMAWIDYQKAYDMIP